MLDKCSASELHLQHAGFFFMTSFTKHSLLQLEEPESRT